MEFKRDAATSTDKATEWIDANLPSCPLCGTSRTPWEHAIQFDPSGATRYHYRCPHCHGVFSIPMNNVTHTFSTWPARQDDMLRLEARGDTTTVLVVGREYILTSLKEVAHSVQDASDRRSRSVEHGSSTRAR
ncbi:MAG: hypothetical protein SA339_06635 [Methanomassiliicoccus sp.]|nr:hypothetical protein [Methanomassiliicoccus sp.]